MIDPFRLDDDAVEQFIRDGYLRLDDAFPPALADAARAVLWHDTGCDEGDPSTWREPVIRLDQYAHPPFQAILQSERLHHALDRLVGVGRWLPPRSIGTFPVRFPSPSDPGDTGWHIDVSFGFDDPDFLAWRANICSRGRALLLLMLFSDVGEDDAPTRIRVGSHRSVARLLAPAGEAGLTLRELVTTDWKDSAHCPESQATGLAGTIYVCHPFLVHAGQRHRGTRPRFLAQPPILPREPLDPWRPEPSPVERAIRLALP